MSSRDAKSHRNADRDRGDKNKNNRPAGEIKRREITIEDKLNLLSNYVAKVDTKLAKYQLDDRDVISALNRRFHIVAEILESILRTLNTSLLCYVLGVENSSRSRKFNKDSASWRGSSAFVSALVNRNYLQQNHFVNCAFIPALLSNPSDRDIRLAKIMSILATAVTGAVGTTISNRPESEDSSSRSARPLLGTPSTTSTDIQQRSTSEIQPSLELMKNRMVESGRNLVTPLVRALSSGSPSQPETRPLPLTVLALIQNGADLTTQDCEPGGISPLMWLFSPHCHEFWVSDDNVRKHWGPCHTAWLETWWNAHLHFNSKDVKKTVVIWAMEFDKTVRWEMPEVEQDDAEPRPITEEEELRYEEMLSTYRFLQDKSRGIRLPPGVPAEIIKQWMDEGQIWLESWPKGKSYPQKEDKGKEKERGKQKEIRTGGFFSGRGRN